MTIGQARRGEVALPLAASRCSSHRAAPRRADVTWSIWIWLVGAVLLLTPLETAAAGTKRVLLLHSFGAAFAPFSVVAAQFREDLIKAFPEPIDLYEASLETARFKQPDDETALADHLRALFRDRQLDLVVVSGAPANRFFQRHRKELFPSTPLLIMAVEQRNVIQTGNDTAVPVRFHLPDFVTNILALLPRTENIAVVIGDSPLERAWLGALQSGFQQFEDRIKFHWLNGLSFDEMRKRVGDLPPRSAIFYMFLVTDGNGVPYEQDRALRGIHAAANAPIFSHLDNTLGLGVVGGAMIPVQEQGRQVAKVAIRILGGERADDIRIPAVVLGSPIYDWRELQRWKISEVSLPPNSEVRFRSPGMWELYRWYIVGAISLIAFQMMLIVSFLMQRAKRQTAEMGIRARESELRSSYDQVRQLAGRLIYAQEEERTRIGRELHDDVGQRVASLSIGLSSLKRRVSNSDEVVRNEVSGLQQQVMGLAKDMRDLSHELHPGALRHVGLLEALRGRCAEMNGELDTRMEVEVADGWSEVADDIELCLYRVAQESLRNIAKHAHANRGRIWLAHQNGQVVMRIADDGRGFQATGSNGQQGIGLLSMRERVRMLKGSFEVESSSIGTVATVVIPTGERN